MNDIEHAVIQIVEEFGRDLDASGFEIERVKSQIRTAFLKTEIKAVPKQVPELLYDPFFIRHD